MHLSFERKVNIKILLHKIQQHRLQDLITLLKRIRTFGL